MKQGEIIKIEKPVVVIEDVYKEEGVDYIKRPPRPGTVAIHEKILAEASEIALPALVCREVEVIKKSDNKVYLEGGHELTSKLLSEVVSIPGKLVMFAMTVGETFDLKVSEYTEKNKLTEAFVMDATATVFMLKSFYATVAELAGKYQKKGLKTTEPLGPGHSYWESFEDMQVLFHFLTPERIGIHLTESNSLKPSKSIAFVMGVAGNKA